MREFAKMGEGMIPQQTTAARRKIRLITDWRMCRQNLEVKLIIITIAVRFARFANVAGLVSSLITRTKRGGGGGDFPCTNNLTDCYSHRVYQHLYSPYNTNLRFRFYTL